VSSWPTVESDLRRALLAAGRPPPVVDRVLTDLQPVFTAVERARGRVEDELIFALLAVAADRARRGGHHALSTNRGIGRKDNHIPGSVKYHKPPFTMPGC
jgi:hypothetical protein